MRQPPGFKCPFLENGVPRRRAVSIGFIDDVIEPLESGVIPPLSDMSMGMCHYLAGRLRRLKTQGLRLVGFVSQAVLAIGRK